MDNIAFKVHFTRLLDEGIARYTFDVDDPESVPMQHVHGHPKSDLWAVGPLTLVDHDEGLQFPDTMLIVTAVDKGKRGVDLIIWGINDKGEFVRSMEA